MRSELPAVDVLAPLRIVVVGSVTGKNRYEIKNFVLDNMWITTDHTIFE